MISCRSLLLAATVALPAAVHATPNPAEPAHPRLLLAPDDVGYIRESLAESPGFLRSLSEKRETVDRYFAAVPDVPLPVDAGGGYTHEQHKKNGIAIHDAGILYQLAGKRSYAEKAKQLLLAYAAMYPQLGDHPEKKEQAPGRLFWQSLNEAVWLVYAIQGYDAIHDALAEAERTRIEADLLRPMAEFLSAESPQTFDRMHNHGTWAAAAVGMTGYVLADPVYVERALYGLNRDGSAGFIKQLDQLFSPDGYYSEGPYYQRYALMPFVLFARSIEANQPELGIFQHRDGILLKAIYASIDLSYAGLFFPLNDAIKDKGIDTIELRYGLAIAYALTGDPALLSVAARQKCCVPTGDGFRMALARDRGQAEPYQFRSLVLRDGPDGEQGALVVLRSGVDADQQALVLKATAQGMGHGHFDKLNWLFYDNGLEIITDYGAARFLNIEQKDGGRYLPENASWARQTVAHNTLVVDERSHFDGQLSVAQRLHPTLLFFDNDDRIQIAAAAMRDAYDQVQFDRTMAMVYGLARSGPAIIDVLRAVGAGQHQYDLPLHFNGQIVNVSHALQAYASNLRPAGIAHGYQHLWLRAHTKLSANDRFSLTWLTGNRFYTYSMIALGDMEVLFVELGANDANFNLRREQAVIFRVRGVDAHTFVSVLEPHGEYNGAEEYTVGSRGMIEEIRYRRSEQAELLRIRTADGGSHVLLLADDGGPDAPHSIDVGDRVHHWNGYYALVDESPERSIKE